MQCYPFFQGGILRLSNTTNNNVLVDAFTNKAYTFESKEISEFNILNSLKLCECGLTIPNRILIRCMGKQDLGQFLKTREEFFE